MKETDRLRDAYNVARCKQVAAKYRGDRKADYEAQREMLRITTELRKLEKEEDA